MITFNGKEAREILQAVNVARSEMGEGFESIEKKILKAYPEILTERADFSRRLKEASDEQHNRRKAVTDKFISEVAHPTVESVVSWYLTNEKFIRDHYSDEICISGDLFRNLPQPQLSELITSLRASKGRNDYESSNLKSRSDSDLWHSLIPFIEKATYLKRCEKSLHA